MTNSLALLSDELLLDSYVKAKELKLSSDFIALIYQEIERRYLHKRSYLTAQ